MEPTPTVKFDHATGRVAVRSVYPEDAWNAYFVGDPKDGGHWATADEVAGFTDVPVPAQV